MAEALSWESRQQTLILRGDLDRETLLPLWQQRNALLSASSAIDVTDLRRVDSSGLALLLHFCEQRRQGGAVLKICGVTERLQTLIALYNLQDIMLANTAS